MDRGREKNPTKHNFFGPWANKLHAHFLFKNEKKICKKKTNHNFLDHGLTNFVPIFRKNSFGENLLKKIPNGHNNLLGPWAKELCTQLQKTLIKKFEKNS